MKRIILFLLTASLWSLACQKSLSVETVDNGTEGDSISFIAGDVITYEVITKDTGGWFGIWTDENGEVKGTGLDSITWGSANYYASGWKYTFTLTEQSAQLMLSVASRNFSDDISINLYKNGTLFKTATNTAMNGVAKILYHAVDSATPGTSQSPVLTYEVLLSEMDTSTYQSDGWNGQWFTGNGIMNTLENPLTTSFAIPSGWRYSFKPQQLPFTMTIQAWPYSAKSAKVTINFYVNGQLVKTSSAYDLNYPAMTYDVL